MKKIISVLLIGIMMLQLTACGGAKINASNVMEGVEPGVIDEVELGEEFADLQMDFSVDLFKRAVFDSKNKNVLISPISVQLALAMTANGAAGETHTEMESLLAEGYSMDALNQYLYSYLRRLEQDEVLKIANSIWFREDERLTIQEDFLQKNADYYGAGIYKSAFDNTTIADMNRWVTQYTDGMIDEIIEEISQDNIMFLLNALAFEAEWEYEYEGNDVYSGEFTSVNGELREVDMMHSIESSYLEDENAIGFKKDYKGGKYSYAVLLPNEDVSIFEYVAGLTAEELRETLANEKSYAVMATMPKFSLEYEQSLNEMLKTLGMKLAFDSEVADFSELGTSSRGNIFINEVFHKTFIQVDELGTKAGAVTKVEVNDESAFMSEYQVTLNRPFVYMIVDNETNLPIFMGTMMDTDTSGPATLDLIITETTNYDELCASLPLADTHVHNHQDTAEITIDPIYATCGNTNIWISTPEGEYEFWGDDSVTLTNIVENLVYKEEALCRCMTTHMVKTELGNEYEVNIEEGFVRCERGQADLCAAQLETIREIMGRLENN